MQPKCNICNTSLHEVLLIIQKPDRFEKAAGISEKNYQRQWFDCSFCHTAVNVQPSKNLYKLEKIATRYYEIDLGPNAIPIKYEKIMSLPPVKSDNFQRADRIIQTIKKIFPHHSNTIYKVLDIGGGIGVFLSLFLSKINQAHNYWKGVTIESDPYACAHLKSLNQFSVIESKFEDYSGFADFNLCTLNKIIEHIQNPIEFLKKVTKTLHLEKSILYIEVPDKSTIAYSSSEDNILGSLHHNLYDIKSLTYILEAAGLTTLNLSTVIEPSGKITTLGFACLPHQKDLFIKVLI